MTHFNEWTPTEWTRRTGTRVARIEVDALTGSQPLRFMLFLKHIFDHNASITLPNGRKHKTFYPLTVASLEEAKGHADAFLNEEWGDVLPR